MAAHLSAEPAYRAAFLHEAQVAAEVNHPNVVLVHRRGRSRGAALPRDGLDRRTKLRQLGEVSIGRAVALVRQVGARWTHCTRRASSTATSSRRTSSCTGEDHVYLLDFGVARRSEYTDARTNELVGGTPPTPRPHHQAPRPHRRPQRTGQRARLRQGHPPAPRTPPLPAAAPAPARRPQGQSLAFHLTSRRAADAAARSCPAGESGRAEWLRC
jgi:hypothetical protein